MVFCGWFLLLSITFSRFIHVVACISASCFLWLNNIPFYGCTTFYSSVDGYLGCFHFLVIVNNAAVNIHVQNFVKTHVFNYFGYIYPGAEFLDHMVILCLIV